MKILLIEQNKVFQAILAQALAGRAIELISVKSAADGLAILEVQDVDFICLTLHLPDENGLDLAARIRRLPAYCYIPIVLLTAETSTELSDQALTQGITEVFHKQAINELLNFIGRHEEFNRPFYGKILYIEDSMAQAEVLRKQLASRSLDVDHFVTAEEAWEAFLKTTYDLVVTDINLGSGMGGLALTNRIRRLESIKGDTPILALTGFDDIGRRINLFHMGVNDYVAKPVVQEELLARIYNLVGRRRFMDSTRREMRQGFDHVLLQLARSSLAANGLLQDALEEIATKAGAALDVQTSIWLLDGSSHLHCRAHDGQTGFDGCGCPTLAEQDLPAYFLALNHQRVISAEDASTHPNTHEMADVYLIPRDIVSVLNAPVRQGNRLLGVVCHEQKHSRRVWSVDEEAFAAGVGEQVARVLADYKHWQSVQELHLANRVMQSAPVSIMITDPQQKIIFVNRAFEKVSGYWQDEVIGQTPRMFSSGRHSRAFYRDMWDNIHRAGSWQGEIFDRRKNGEVYPKRLIIKRLNNEQGDITHYVGMALDLSLEHAQQSQIKFLAFHDSLTGLANRTLFADRLVGAISRATRNGVRVAVLYIDLDRFKVINDSFGHESGDLLLKEVANRLKACIRECDTLCRQGGDEFLVIIDDVSSADDLSVVAQRMLEAVSQPFSANGKVYSPQISMGISIFPDDADNDSDLVKNADMAMYQAKERGRNRYQFFTEELNRTTQLKANLESDLRRALNTAGELHMVYQPKISMGRGSVVGFEALVRWSPSPDKFIPPDLFIHIAEESHQIEVLGTWIIEDVLSQMASWRGSALEFLPVAINISPIQLKHPGFVQHLASACDAKLIPRSQIELEITEGVFIGDLDGARSILEEVKAAGFKLTLDDFGTGYSSFSYLASLPLDALKIDRAFVWKIGNNSKSAAVLKAIIALAKELGLGLVAEGVETLEQANWLLDAGADIAQGYYYARPERPEKLLALSAIH
jgi:diguanylate cyclase (GGDEF)-like protein/PAS domain S-box-containing protein